jgi:hypoxanthine-guanine phosphoribosyltransferase
MSPNEMNSKIADAVEFYGGHLVLGALLTIITGTTMWMLSVEIEQGKQLSALVAISQERSAENVSIRLSVDKLTADMHELQISVSGIKQELMDRVPVTPQR